MANPFPINDLAYKGGPPVDFWRILGNSDPAGSMAEARARLQRAWQIVVQEAKTNALRAQKEGSPGLAADLHTMAQKLGFLRDETLMAADWLNHRQGAAVAGSRSDPEGALKALLAALAALGIIVDQSGP